MPRILGVNLLGWVLASVAIFAVGFVWYGVVFAEAWMSAGGVTEADYEGNSPLWMLAGMVLPFVIALGIGKTMAWRGVTGLVGGVGTGLALAVLLALPVLGYTLVYMPQHAVDLFAIDAGHTLVGWALGGAVLGLFR